MVSSLFSLVPWSFFSFRKIPLSSFLSLFLSEAKEAFNIFDKLHEGKVLGKDIPNLLRAVGQNPTELELGKIFEGKADKKFSFDEYLAIQNRPDGWKRHGTKEEVKLMLALGSRIDPKKICKFLLQSSLK